MLRLPTWLQPERDDRPCFSSPPPPLKLIFSRISCIFASLCCGLSSSQPPLRCQRCRLPNCSSKNLSRRHILGNSQSEALLTEALMIYQNGLPPDHPEIADCTDKVTTRRERSPEIHVVVAEPGCPDLLLRRLTKHRACRLSGHTLHFSVSACALFAFADVISPPPHHHKHTAGGGRGNERRPPTSGSPPPGGPVDHGEDPSPRGPAHRGGAL